MNAHKGILREMKCDRSFEIIHLFTEGILETVRPRQVPYLLSPSRAKPIPPRKYGLICFQTSCWISFGSRPLLP